MFSVNDENAPIGALLHLGKPTIRCLFDANHQVFTELSVSWLMLSLSVRFASRAC